MELKQAKFIVGVLCAAYRVNEPATATVYIEMLKDLDAVDAEEAVTQLIKEEAEWMPSVKMIRDRVNMLVEGRRVLYSDTALPPPREPTPEELERIKDILGEYWGSEDAHRLAVLEYKARTGDVEAKVERARMIAKMQEEQGG